MDTLYFDGQCSLCSREIEFLKKHASELQFINIHELDDKHIPSKDDLLKVLHLKSSINKTNPEWLKGLDATIQAWSHTPYSCLISILKWPLINIVAKRAYSHWANKRFCKLYK